jgi:hypothetical protein
MHIILLVFIVCLTALLGIAATSTPADAEVICRTYYYWSGSRRCWRRTCWRVPDRYYAPDPRPYRENTTKSTRAQWWDNDDDDATTSTRYYAAPYQATPHSPPRRRLSLDDWEDISGRSPKSSRPWRDPDNHQDHATAAPNYTAPKHPAPRTISQPPRQSPQEFVAIFFIICIVAGLSLLIRFASWLDAVIKQRRLDRIERQVLTARSLKQRLERDAYDTDQLIRLYAQEAYRRGRG